MANTKIKANDLMAESKANANSNINGQSSALDLYKTTSADGLGGEENIESTGDVYQDELSKAAKEKNYKNFYNSAMQLYNYEQNSKKYLNNSLASAGLNTQGYGSSQMAGINNQAINLYNQNLNSLNEANATADQEALDRQTETDEQLITYLNNAYTNGYSTDLINQYMKNYGYVDDDGNVDTSKMNAYVKSMYDTVTGNATSDTTSKTITDLGTSKESNDVNAKNFADTYKDSYTVLQNMVERNDISDGQAVVLHYKGSKVYLLYNDGEFTEISSTDFYNSNNKRYIYNGKEINGETWTSNTFSSLSGLGGELGALRDELKTTGDKYKDGEEHEYKYNGNTYTIAWINNQFYYRKD